MTNYLPYENEDDLLKVDSDPIDIESFIETSLHSDFQRELEIRIDMLTLMLDDPDQKYKGRDYDVFRGGKRAFIEVRNLFTDMLDAMLEAKKEKKDV